MGSVNWKRWHSLLVLAMMAGLAVTGCSAAAGPTAQPSSVLSSPTTAQSQEPSATTAATGSAASTGTTSLVPTSSLPEDLTNKTWVELGSEAVAPYTAGTLDNSAHLTLPAGEWPLDAADGRVASVVVHGTTRDTLIVRDVTTGAVVARYQHAGALISHAVLGSSAAYFLMQPDAATSPSGVYALDLNTGAVTTLAAPDVERNALVLSPSGQTLVAEVGTMTATSSVDVIRLPSGSHSRFEVKGVAQLTSDRLFVTTDTINLYGYDLATGRLAWTIPDVLLQGAYFTSDGSRIVMQTGAGSATGQGRGLPPSALENRISIVDAATGAAHTLLAVPQGKPGYFLWTQLSNDRAAVLLTPADYPQEAFQAGYGTASAAVLNLATGGLTPNAVMITER
jgi:hypothetical protein